MVAAFHDAGLEVIQISRVVFIVGSAVNHHALSHPLRKEQNGND